MANPEQLAILKEDAAERPPLRQKEEIMAETIKLTDNLFGYDTLIREGGEFVSLSGQAVPELSKGMKVVLVGDSKGYVPSHFKPGEEVTIVGFTKPFEGGESNHIVQVTNGQHTGWVKPSNIQRNVVEPKGRSHV